MAKNPDNTTEKTELAAENTNAELQLQIEQLKEDIASIAATLSNMGQEKLRGAQENISKAYDNLHANSEEVFDNVANCASHFEEQLTTSIKERPITSVAIAAGLGYLLALLRR